MAKSAAKNTPAQNFETITSNSILIEKGSLKAGKISFQIRNIASLLVSRDEATDRTLGVFAFFGAVIAAMFVGSSTNDGGAGFMTFLAAGVFLLAILYMYLGQHQLRLITNAATSFLIVHKKEQFLILLKEAIEEAMQAEDYATSYQISVAEQRIDRVEARSTTFATSPEANAIAGAARSTNHTSNVQIQGLQDVAELIALIERVAAGNANDQKALLEVVRSYLAGGSKTKSDAKAAWDKFVENVGSIAGAGNKVWELVGRIASALT